MRYLLLTLLFPFVTHAGSLELGLGMNLQNAVNESTSFNYKLGYNYDFYRSEMAVGTAISYEYYSQIAQTIDIKANMTTVTAKAAKLGFFINEEIMALARFQYELGVSFFDLSKTPITPTGGNLYGAYYSLGLLFSNESVTTKFSYTLDYAKNRSEDFGVDTIFMHSFKIGVMFEL